MIKRPLHPQFGKPVLAEVKITTIRAKPWPVGVPIMLYHWQGAAYHSKQRDVAVIVVESTQPITLTRQGDTITTSLQEVAGKPLWQTEGFASPQDFQAWFLKLVKPGQTLTQHLMRMRLTPSKDISQIHEEAFAFCMANWLYSRIEAHISMALTNRLPKRRKDLLEYVTRYRRDFKCYIPHQAPHKLYTFKGKPLLLVETKFDTLTVKFTHYFPHAELPFHIEELTNCNLK